MAEVNATESKSLFSTLEPTYEPPKREVDQTLGKDDFLELLLVQMRNQDPLKPQDQTESIAQLAQFSSLEQMTNLNESMTNLLSAYQASNKSSTLSMIGRGIEGFKQVENADGTNTPEEVVGIVRGVDLTGDEPILVIQTEEGTVRIPQTQVKNVSEILTGTDETQTEPTGEETQETTGEESSQETGEENSQDVDEQQV